MESIIQMRRAAMDSTALSINTNRKRNTKNEPSNPGMGRRHLDYISILPSKHLQEDNAQKQLPTHVVRGDKPTHPLGGFLDLRPRQRRGLGSHAIVVFWLSFAHFVGLDN
jgi:hypothetical protein